MGVFVFWIIWHFVQFSAVSLGIYCFHSKSVLTEYLPMKRISLESCDSVVKRLICREQNFILRLRTEKKMKMKWNKPYRPYNYKVSFTITVGPVAALTLNLGGPDPALVYDKNILQALYFNRWTHAEHFWQRSDVIQPDGGALMLTGFNNIT